jgi:MmgE/PrpD N-terminal domain
MTICEEWGAWAASLTAADAPEHVAERARLQTTSVIAAANAGAKDAAPFAAVAPDGPAGEVYRGAAASIAHDWDDYLYMGHTGHSAVWVARALTDDPDRALAAQIAGNELAGRLGAALFLGPHNGQFWASIHCAGAAAAAGVALGLDGAALAHALAIALYQPPYGLMPGFMGPPTKLLTAAEPAAAGVRAALLAAEGVTGALDVIEARDGLLRHFAYAARPGMLGALGQVWLTDTLAFKSRPGCAYVQAAVDGALRAGAAASDVERVTVDAGLLTVAMEREGARAGLTPVGVNFSAARSVAVALIAGRLTPAELAPAWLAEHAREIEDLAARVRVRHDWALTLNGARGVVDAGGSVGDVPLSALPALVRRARAIGNVGGRADAGVATEAWRLLRRARGTGGDIASLDTARLRLDFPCRVRIHLRSGDRLEIDGRDEGACGAPLDEQRAVVEAKQALVLA